MSKTIDLNTDNKTKEQLKSAEFIRVDDVVFVRKDHAVDILNRVVDDRKKMRKSTCDVIITGKCPLKMNPPNCLGCSMM